LVLFLGVTGLGADALGQTQVARADGRPRAIAKGAGTDHAPAHIVTPSTLRVTVVAQGIVEPWRTTVAFCHVKGGATICWIVPDGTIVQKGQPVCQLVSSRLREPRASGTILAGIDGIVVHANEPDRGDSHPVIEAGAIVGEFETIFTIRDFAGPMRVDVKVPESVIDQVNQGLTAHVTIDTSPGAVLTGVVSEVALLPDPICFFDGFVNTYTTKVELHQDSKAVRPGMSAKVEIVIAELANVLAVPIQAVVSRDGKNRLAVKNSDGEIEWRDVTLGLSDGKLVEVTDGIESGEALVVKPQTHSSEE
jgi:HlyD family secretion protein